MVGPITHLDHNFPQEFIGASFAQDLVKDCICPGPGRVVAGIAGSFHLVDRINYFFNFRIRYRFRRQSHQFRF